MVKYPIQADSVRAGASLFTWLTAGNLKSICERDTFKSHFNKSLCSARAADQKAVLWSGGESQGQWNWVRTWGEISLKSGATPTWSFSSHSQCFEAVRTQIYLCTGFIFSTCDTRSLSEFLDMITAIISFLCVQQNYTVCLDLYAEEVLLG